MFRYISVLLFVLLQGGVVAEDIASPEQLLNKPFEFTEVREAKGLNKEEITSNIAAFIAEKFTLPKKAVVLNDPIAGRIIFKLNMFDPDTGFTSYIRGISVTLSADAKDGRFRLKAAEVAGLRTTAGNVTADIEGEYAADIKPMAYKLLTDFLDRLDKYLKSAKKDNNW